MQNGLSFGQAIPFIILNSEKPQQGIPYTLQPPHALTAGTPI